MNNAAVFLQDIQDTIKTNDAFHYKKINANVNFLQENYRTQYEELLNLVYNYFKNGNLSTAEIAQDYLKMVSDMRREGKYFYKTGKYRCENQSDAYENVYSKTEVMSYYMNALLVSQILWKHHFVAFMFFQDKLKSLFPEEKRAKILDVGPGHGFFSFLVKKELPNYEKIDAVDISETSLNMTRKILGTSDEKINYYLKDIFNYSEGEKYDLIVLGEVIEHLDNPKSILIKLASLLTDDGVLWVTTPTNSPALDHVYLFHTKQDVLDLLSDSGLESAHIFSSFAEDVDDATALKLKVTDLVGVFCKNK